MPFGTSVHGWENFEGKNPRFVSSASLAYDCSGVVDTLLILTVDIPDFVDS